MDLKKLKDLNNQLINKEKIKKAIIMGRQRQIDMVGLRDFHRDLMYYYDKLCQIIAEELRVARSDSLNQAKEAFEW